MGGMGFYLRQSLVRRGCLTLFRAGRGRGGLLQRRLRKVVESGRQRIVLGLRCLRRSPLRFIVLGHLQRRVRRRAGL